MNAQGLRRRAPSSEVGFILAEAKRRGMMLRLQNGQMRFWPRDVMTPDLERVIRDNKKALVAFLSDKTNMPMCANACGVAESKDSSVLSVSELPMTQPGTSCEGLNAQAEHSPTSSTLERMATCTIDGGLPDVEAENISLEELNRYSLLVNRRYAVVMAIYGDIRQAVESSGKSRLQLSRETDILQSQFSDFMSGKKGLSVEALERLAESLGLEIVVKRKRRQDADRKKG